MESQDGQLCAGLKAVIDGAVHGVQDVWDEKQLWRIGYSCS